MSTVPEKIPYKLHKISFLSYFCPWEGVKKDSEHYTVMYTDCVAGFYIQDLNPWYWNWTKSADLGKACSVYLYVGYIRLDLYKHK